MGIKMYVNEITITNNGKHVCISKPDLEVVLKSLNDIEKGNVGYIKLRNTDTDIGMTIFADPGLYHIGIVDFEKCMNYYYWNGMEPTDKLVDIAGHSFDEHMVCNDFTILSKIVREFCISGERLNSVEWIHEEC